MQRVVIPAVAQDRRLAILRVEDGAAGGNLQPVRLNRDAVRVLLALHDRVFEREDGAAGAPDIGRLAPHGANLQRQGGRAARHVHGHRFREGQFDPDRVADPVGLRGAGDGEALDGIALGRVVVHPQPGEALGQGAAQAAHPARRHGVVRVVGEPHRVPEVRRILRIEGQYHLPSRHLDRARSRRLDVAPRPGRAQHGEIDRALARSRGRGGIGQLEVPVVGQCEGFAVHHRAHRHRPHGRGADTDIDGGGGGNAAAAGDGEREGQRPVRRRRVESRAWRVRGRAVRIGHGRARRRRPGIA